MSWTGALREVPPIPWRCLTYRVRCIRDGNISRAPNAYLRAVFIWQRSAFLILTFPGAVSHSGITEGCSGPFKVQDGTGRLRYRRRNIRFVPKSFTKTYGLRGANVIACLSIGSAMFMKSGAGSVPTPADMS